MRKIDACIRHITKGGANLFVELGFALEEAQRYRGELEIRCKQNEQSVAASRTEATDERS